jgi:hypothetical protein
MQVFSLYKSQDSAGVAARMPADPSDQLAQVGKLVTENGGEYFTKRLIRSASPGFLALSTTCYRRLCRRWNVATVR